MYIDYADKAKERKVKMKKDVWCFYSGLLDKEVMLPVSIMTYDEFLQYYKKLGHEAIADVGPKPLTASELLRDTDRLYSWVHECKYDFPVFAVCDDAMNTEFDDSWFAYGLGRYNENGELQYEFN